MKRFLTALPFIVAALIVAGWFVLDKLSIGVTEVPPARENAVAEPVSYTDEADETESMLAGKTAVDASMASDNETQKTPQLEDELPAWKRVALERERKREEGRGNVPGSMVQKVVELEPETRKPAVPKPPPGERPDRSRSSTSDSSQGDRSRGRGRNRTGTDEAVHSPNQTTQVPREVAKDADPSSDREAPEISMVEFVPTEILDGQSTTIVVTATDNLSGVRFVTGTVRSPGGASLGFSTKVESPGRFTGSVQIPAKSEEGEWYVFQMRAMDQANNVKTVSWTTATAPPTARFRVKSNDSDTNPPVLTAIRLDHDTVAQGAPNVVHVDVTDDKSGVQSVYGLFASPSGSATAAFNCRADGGSLTWSGQVVIPENADCGEWKLRQVTLTDKANNRATVAGSDPIVSDTKFFLSFGGSCDSEPPVVSLIEISPAVVSNDTQNQVQITAWVQDNSSGVQHVGGRFVGPRTDEAQPPYLHFSLKEDPSDSRAWKGTVTVPRYAARGIWTLQLVQVVDKASNRDNLSAGHAVLAGLGITVE